MNGPVFSVILFIDKMEKFPFSLSFFNSEAQQEQIQLIVIDPLSDREMPDCCRDFKGYDLTYLFRPGIQVSEAYQEALGYAKGKYVNFSLASSYFSKNIFSCIHKAFLKYDGNMISVAPYFIKNEEMTLYDGAYKMSGEGSLIHLLLPRESDHVQLMLQAYFFKREILNSKSFLIELGRDSLYQFILNLLSENPEFLYLFNYSYYYTEPIEDTHSQDPLQLQSQWYSDSVRDFILPLLQSAKERFGSVPVFMQNACYYLIYVKIRCNLYNKDKGVLKTQEDVKKFYDLVFQALSYINNDIILRSKIFNNISTDKNMCIFLLRGKEGNLGRTFRVIDNNNTFLALFEAVEGDNKLGTGTEENICVLGSCLKEPLEIRTINYENGIILIDAYTNLLKYFSLEEFSIYAVCDEKGTQEETYKAEFTDVYPQIRCFGVTFSKKQAVHFSLPLNGKTKQTFRFFYCIGDNEYQFNLNFSAYNARIFPNAKDPYWLFRKGWMLRPNEKRTEIVIEKCGNILHLKKELRFCQSLSKMGKYKDISSKGVLLRFLYWLLLPFFQRKRIWVTFDKLYKGGDNGEYLFQYIRKSQKDIDMYYIIRKDSPDYQRLVKQHHRHVLVYGTMRCQLIFLFAQIILATHAELSNRYNPDKKYNAFTKDLQRGEVICVQHGLTIQEIAQYQNRFVDNTKLYCCASPYEVKNLNHPVYGYNSEQLKMTGLARYDGLKNRNHKIILIAPTWRRNIAKTSVTDVRDRYNDNFKYSKYFRIYNDLINDKTLLKSAKEKGYRIVYLVHPVVSAQIEDFTHNGYVEFLSGEDVDYEDILCEASLMVTDYSGIQYDFAYMRKPIIYFHPAELPPHYEEGGMDYEAMGFGPIFTNLEDTVAEICRKIEQDCLMDERYKKRADDFFAFDDHNNCERIFNTVKDYYKSRKNWNG